MGNINWYKFKEVLQNENNEIWFDCFLIIALDKSISRGESETALSDIFSQNDFFVYFVSQHPCPSCIKIS